MDPFNWYAQKEDANKIMIFNYNGLEGKSTYMETTLRFNILSAGDELDKALSIADQLPQVKMFRWRAHAVAVNAFYGNGTWSLEYYDPIQRMEMRDFSSTFGINTVELS